MPKQNSKFSLLVLLLAGGLAGLCLCCSGVGVGGYFLFFSGPPVMGKWKGAQEDSIGDTIVREWDFKRNGTGQIKEVRINKFTKHEAEPAFVHFEYNLVEAQSRTLLMKITRIEGAVSEEMKRDVDKSVRYKVALGDDSLRLTKGGVSYVMKRID